MNYRFQYFVTEIPIISLQITYISACGQDYVNNIDINFRINVFVLENDTNTMLSCQNLIVKHDSLTALHENICGKRPNRAVCHAVSSWSFLI